MKRSFAIAIFAALASANVGAQPVFGNPSPTAGSSTSQKANEAADQAAYKKVEYANKDKKGPALVGQLALDLRRLRCHCRWPDVASAGSWQ